MCFGLVDLVVWCSDVGVSSADFSLSVSVSSFNGGGAIKWFGVSHVFVIGGGGGNPEKDIMETLYTSLFV